MIKEDTVIKLEDNKEYYVLDSMMHDNNNFIMKGLEAWELGDSYSNSISVTKLVRYTTFSKSFPFT